jgi:hypothetical protein
MDPVSIVSLTGSVFGICFKLGDAIRLLSKCIDQAKSGQVEARALQSQVVGLYTTLSENREFDNLQQQKWARQFSSIIGLVETGAGELDTLLSNVVEKKVISENGVIKRR